MKRINGFLKTELYRCFFSLRFVLGVATVLAVLLAGLQEQLTGIFHGRDVFSCFLYTMDALPHILVLSGAAVTYAGSLYEDMENRFIRNQVMRGDLKAYLVARVLTLFVSAQVTLWCGGMLFVSVLRSFCPWVIEETGYGTGMYESIFNWGVFNGLLTKGHYWLYFMAWCAVYGCLAGILTLLSAWVSLYIPSRALMLIAPVVAFYFLELSVTRFIRIHNGLSRFFTIDYCWTQSTGAEVLLMAGLTVLSMLVSGFLMYKKLTKGGIVCG